MKTVLFYLLCFSFSLSVPAVSGGKAPSSGTEDKASPLEATINLLNQEYAIQKAEEEEKELEMKGQEDPRQANDFCCGRNMRREDLDSLHISDSSRRILRDTSGQTSPSSTAPKTPVNTGTDSGQE